MRALRETIGHPMLATKDAATARRFYGETLGLETRDSDPPGGFAFFCAGNQYLVYPSAFAGTNKANAIVWSLKDPDFDRTIRELREANVILELYPDMEGVELKDGVHLFGAFKLVWFKDPDGNVLHITNIVE